VFTIRGLVDAGGQGGRVGTLCFIGEAVADELELAGVRQPRSPATVSLTRGARCQHAHGPGGPRRSGEPRAIMGRA
jgi:hypothetical protein